MESLKRELTLLLEEEQLLDVEGKPLHRGSGSPILSAAIDVSNPSVAFINGTTAETSLNLVAENRVRTSSLERVAPSSAGVSFNSKVGPHHKNAFAAEALEIIMTATIFYNNN